ncbi:beta-glucosidase [Paenibacillus sp. FSL P4-0081]|uniref:glycoside hydrolase family 3 N-terminal domain-containing protein n=1 Tax=unclassified Paenibacillus TaxID=185978 RepID=UPI0004F7FE59|nr:glycoside hydrolase family 3 N-terminal domain-containing protein [Paenibacillus sp. FSL P4-0081]AIQ31530.1 beta-glucosidase [Paenibacillus sp. FSL P4-0081]
MNNKRDYLNATLSPETRAEALLQEMDVYEKLGQLVCYMPEKLSEYDVLDKNYAHGVGHVSSLQMRALETLEDAVRLQREVQEKVMALSKHHIPAIFHMEGLCGAYIQGATSFPSGIGRGASWNPQLEQEIGRIVARQERAVGITHVFAPVLDISRDSRFGRQGETYGEDPTLASAMGVSFLKGIQEETTGKLRSEGVAKHFLGFHGSDGGIHGAHCDIPPRLLQEVYGKPFQAAITEGDLKGIMPCYASINGEPISASEEILTKLLREEMGFEGMAVSDYCAIMNVHHVQKLYESDTEAGLQALSAGMDVELHFIKCFNDELADWFNTGKADITLLDRAVKRVLEAKFRMGLFEQPFALTGEQLYEAFNDSKDEQITLQSARESLVLLKNDGVLPIKKDVKKIAVIGCHANNARIFFGGYTHFSMTEGLLASISTMAGLETKADDQKQAMETIPGTPIQVDNDPAFDALLQQQKPGTKSLLEHLKDSMPAAEIEYSYGYPIAGNDISGHEKALAMAKDADLVIVTLGGKHGTSSIASMGEGIDSTDINLPFCQESFLLKISELQKLVVAVHFNGRPISSDAADSYANAIIEAWNPAEKGAEVITDVLLGAYNPSGKLPVSVAHVAGQIPVYYNHPNGSSYHQGESIAFSNYVDMPHTPRYYFGHGLSYTSFEYSSLQIMNKEVTPDSTVTISFDIKNTGKLKGTEIVQLYLKDRFASMTRPVMELAGFRRIVLKSGEQHTITFQVEPSQIAFLDKTMKWKIEAGDVEVWIGSSSNDIRLKDSFRIISDAYVDGKERKFYSN